MNAFEAWIEEVAAPIAYGLLGLKPWEFERLTPAEFLAMARAARAAREDQEDFIARVATPLINAAGAGKVRSRITQEQLLGRPTQARRRATAAWKQQRALRAAEEAQEQGQSASDSVE